MNKTLKTVFITIAITIVVLFAIIMIFGEDTSIPMGSSSNIEKNSSTESEESPSNTSLNADNNSTESPAADVFEEMFVKTVNYDVFDWGVADEQGKIKIAEDIISVWAADGSSCEMTAVELASFISQNLSDQANVFEVACIAAQIDPQPYINRTN